MDSGKRLALLVGCNYPKTEFRLHGCINDVEAMKGLLLERFGFVDSNIQILTDAPESKVKPTGANIKAALNQMVSKAKAGDVLFFHFSGHGTTIPSLEPGQPFRQDEAIVPCDLNLITDLDLRQLIKGLPEGSSFTILSDSCHSGGLIDKEKEQIGPHHSTVKKLPTPVHYRAKRISAKSIHQYLQEVASIVQGAAELAQAVPNLGSLLSGIFKKDVSIKFQPHLDRDLLKSLSEDEGILLSGCQADETSADMDPLESGGKAYGAFSNAVQLVFKENKGQLTNRQLVMKAGQILKEHLFEQHPCLYCSDKNADSPFLGSRKTTPERPANDTMIANHPEAIAAVAANETVIANHPETVKAVAANETVIANHAAAVGN